MSRHDTDDTTLRVVKANICVHTSCFIKSCRGRFVRKCAEAPSPQHCWLTPWQTAQRAHHSSFSILSSPAGEQPMIDPREIKLQLNIEKRVTAWRSTWIRDGACISHQSKFGVLIKSSLVCECRAREKGVCGWVFFCVLRAPLFSPLVILLTLNYLINVNTICELIHPSTCSRWRAHYFGQGEPRAFTQSLIPPHSASSAVHIQKTCSHIGTFSTSSQHWNVWSIGNPWWRWTQKRSLDPSRTQIMTNIHLDEQGANEGTRNRLCDMWWTGVCYKLLLQLS